MPSRFGKSTVVPAGTAVIRGSKRLLLDAMREWADDGAGEPDFLPSEIQTIAWDAGAGRRSGPRTVTVTRTSPTAGAVGACARPPASAASRARRAATPAAVVTVRVDTSSA